MKLRAFATHDLVCYICVHNNINATLKYKPKIKNNFLNLAFFSYKEIFTNLDNRKY